ncbi:type II 3-dehydroquinate dehydratase [Micromonospora sp. NPDC050397]|uniref:type II 3-dehydroquinate dehydratase n=1 Tax=Micromonospora sp. NPDC050397 TaxID=3364279 RepID=UPI00384B8097
MADILLLNGPNLGVLGTRQPEIYGHTTLAEIEDAVRRRLAEVGYGLRAEQHDGEAQMLGALHRHRDTAGAIVNPGALMIAGWSLRDALAAYDPPWVEVHLSNVWARESFRHHSVISPLALGVVAGFGAYGYLLAVDALATSLSTGGDLSRGTVDAPPAAAQTGKHPGPGAAR